jgi:ubiquinone biosynthesis protein
VMVEGVASALDPDINMWEVSGPYVAEWLRDELGPEARLAELVQRSLTTLVELPDLVRRIEAAYPKPGAAPPPPPIAVIEVGTFAWWRWALVALAGAGIGAAAALLL